MLERHGNHRAGSVGAVAGSGGGVADRLEEHADALFRLQEEELALAGAGRAAVILGGDLRVGVGLLQADQAGLAAALGAAGSMKEKRGIDQQGICPNMKKLAFGMSFFSSRSEMNPISSLFPLKKEGRGLVFTGKFRIKRKLSPLTEVVY